MLEEKKTKHEQSRDKTQDEEGKKATTTKKKEILRIKHY